MPQWNALPTERWIIVLTEYGTQYTIDALYFNANNELLAHDKRKLFPRSDADRTRFEALRDKLSRELGPMLTLLPSTWLWAL